MTKPATGLVKYIVYETESRLTLLNAHREDDNNGRQAGGADDPRA